MLFQTVPIRFAQSIGNNVVANHITKDTRLIVLPNWNSSTEYCSELQSRDIMIHCKARGIPTPRVEILVNGNITEPFRRLGDQDHEVFLRLTPISYGEVMTLECQASTKEFTLNVTVNLTYTCK